MIAQRRPLGLHAHQHPLSGLIEGQIVAFIQIGLRQQQQRFAVHDDQPSRLVVAGYRHNFQRFTQVRLRKITQRITDAQHPLFWRG
ncbi:hypothetical protein D3C81_1590370 [compost metagenome]